MLIRWTGLIALSFSLLCAEKYSLSVLCQKGIDNNPKIKSFSHRTSASNSFYDQSIDQYKPHLNISGQYGKQNYKLGTSEQTAHYQGDNYNYQFSLKQPIYRAQLLHAITDAEARKRLAVLQEEDEKAKLVTMILQSSVELIRHKKIVAILTEKVTLLEKAYENIKKKHAIHLASSTDKFQSLAMLQQARSELIKAQQTYDYNLYNLRLLTKYKDVEKYIVSLGFDIPAVSKAFKKSRLRAIRESIMNNTRIRLDNQTVEIAKLQIGLRNSERSPQLDAVLSYGDSGGTIDYATRQDESRAMITLNFPIYQGGYVDDRVQESKYLYFAAKEEAEDTWLNIEISMEKALQNIKGGLESVKAEKSAVEASKEYFEVMIKSYRNGVVSLTDAYLAEAAYHDNLLRLVNYKADIFVSLADAYYYSGKADFSHVKELQQKFLR